MNATFTTAIEAVRQKQWKRGVAAIRKNGGPLRFELFVAAMFGNSAAAVHDRCFDNRRVQEMVQDGRLAMSWDDYGDSYISLPE